MVGLFYSAGGPTERAPQIGGAWDATHIDMAMQLI